MVTQFKLPASLLKFEWANATTPAMHWAAEHLSGILGLRQNDTKKSDDDKWIIFQYCP
jgi:hypothetical protein